ncbi:hypothetical protein GCM10011399_33940 [Subtercola lobariae]|uniref:Uncharacterized protein n=1 Tax=Subtercola lobariae TaxID=1588641 RepID=A0A917EZX8_9MICO|nr:hypothetical protein GCM10011399_33940 [Subtercola lobariae]
MHTVEWMLQTVAGGGVRLTAAEYLPPAVVFRAMTESGWAEHWVRAENRKDLTSLSFCGRSPLRSARPRRVVWGVSGML